MTFSIQAAGKITDVIDQINAHETQDANTSQFDAVKQLLLSELQKLNENSYYNGTFIEASGHGDSHSRNLKITMRPLHLKG